MSGTTTRQFADHRHRGIPGRTMSAPSAPRMLPALLLLALWIIFVFVAEAAFDHEPMGVLLYIACNSLSLGVTVFVARTTNDTLHPVAFFAMVNFFYSSFYPIGAISPTALFPMSPGDLFEGQRVYAFGTLALCCVYAGIAMRSNKQGPLPPIERDTRVDPAMNAVGVGLAGIAFVLCAYFAVSIGGDASSYLDRVDAIKDESLLGFAISLPMTALGIILAAGGSKTKLGRLGIAFVILGVAAITFLLLKRSFAVRMLIVFAVFYHYKVRRIPLKLFLIGVTTAIFLFILAGYLRRFAGSSIDIENMLSSIVLRDLFDLSVHGEFKDVFRSAVDSARGVIEPLPYAGDYILAWQYSIPKFIIGDGRMISLNVRYALQTIYESAIRGAGLGFSFAGEAYLVFGYVGVFAVYSAMLLFFTRIYNAARRSKFFGFPFFMALVSFFPLIWLQRNSFAFFFKDPVLYSYFFGFVCVMVGRAVFGSRVIGIQAGNNAPARGLPQRRALNTVPGKRNPHFRPLGR